MWYNWVDHIMALFALAVTQVSGSFYTFLHTDKFIRDAKLQDKSLTTNKFLIFENAANVNGVNFLYS